jgi:hypothetical protein
VKRLLKQTAAAILFAVAATVLITAPASATRLSTSIQTTAAVFECPNSCFRHGNAPQDTLARSYCLIGSFDLIFSEGAANRFGDALHRYCQRIDSAGTVWVAIFNNNGSHTGFTRFSDLNLPAGTTFPNC